MGKWSFSKKKFNSEWALERNMSSRKSYILCCPREVDLTAILQYLSGLPGKTLVITEEVCSGYEIYFCCSTPFEVLFKNIENDIVPNECVPRLKKRGRAVKQYTSDGVFVAEYNTVLAAATKLKLPEGNISRCCSGKSKLCGGFSWKYAE